MEKIWLKSYPQGIPAEINPDAYQSIVQFFLESCQKFAFNPAYYNLGVTINYRQLEAYSLQFAAFLQKDLKLSKGTRIAIMLPNCLQYPIALFGALRAGLVIVNVNPLYTPDELTHQLNDSKAEAILVLSNFAYTVEKSLPRIPTLKHIIISKMGDLFPLFKSAITNFALKYILKKIPHFYLPQALTFRSCLIKGKMLKLDPVVINNTDIAFLQYTGGTTGISKGAILTHRNIIANIQQADAWLSVMLDDHEIIVTALPLYHIFSLTANCLYFTKIGGLNILISDPRNLKSMIKEMKKFRFTTITGVNTLFNALVKTKDFTTLDFSKLKVALGGGMAVQRAVAEKWQTLTKRPLLEAYGLTETSPCVTINPTNVKGYNGSIGLPVPSTDIKILDNNQEELGVGESGELAIKGPQVMQGYWENQAETDKVFTPEGYLLTGDIAVIDEQGFLFLKERKKDMILVSGFNVYPNEVEDVIAKCPGIREVAVIGVVDSKSGEAVKAFVVKDDPNLTAEAITQFCRKHLTSYKVPRQIEFKQELPKTNVGKILRRALKNNAA